MVCLFFGLPGAGKTTILASIALKHSRRMGKPYKHIYSNVRLSIPNVTYIDNECIGRYDLSDCLLLIDEATLFADSRDFKAFDKGKLTYFLEHRHYNADVYLFTQQWDGVDRKIRVITDRVYYVYKGILFGWLWSSYYRIPYGIIIPDRKHDEKLGEIIQGYCKPNALVRIFSKKIIRPLYYKYFDSWERPILPPLPLRYKPYIKGKSAGADQDPVHEVDSKDIDSIEKISDSFIDALSGGIRSFNVDDIVKEYKQDDDI